MPWTCPACRLPISHSDTEIRPREGIAYRCHVCRLELVLGPSGRLGLAPLKPGEADHAHEMSKADAARRARRLETIVSDRKQTAKAGTKKRAPGRRLSHK